TIRSRQAGSIEALRVALCLWTVVTTFGALQYAQLGAKHLLLTMPAAVLLLLDGLKSEEGQTRRWTRKLLVISVPASVCLGLLVAISDYRLANSYRELFRRDSQLSAAPGGRAYILGEWGFRYYGERAGHRYWR